uniref:Rho-GAP domain-containing protein n=1 Tax=Wuchereria bancrofti TaxID=6293 RepID=A0AAF5RX94_WUCBA
MQLMFDLNATFLNYSTINNNCNEYDKQEYFKTTESQICHKMSPNKIIAQPTLEYFLAMICDLKVDPKMQRRLGLRYTDTPEVQKLLMKLNRKQYVKNELAYIDANVIITTLKEILNNFSGGIFDDRWEEFLSVSLGSSLQTALVYVNGLILQLPYFLRQFTYLICRSLKNLIQQSAGSTTDAYTDALLLFTPTLFPNSVREINRFLRAARISLILIDLCDVVFRPFLPLTICASANDDDFFHDILDSLTYLCNCLNSDIVNNEIMENMEKNDDKANDDDDNEDDDDIENDNDNDGMLCSMKKLPDATNYYQITYLAD